MATPEPTRVGSWLRVVAARSAVAALAVFGGCKVANLSYAEVERDLDAIVRIDGTGAGQELSYRTEFDRSAWYARWLLLWPFKPALLLLLPATERHQAENPSGEARELLEVLAPRAGSNLWRGTAAVQRLVRVVELDGSALNRITALDGLATVATALGIDLVGGLEGGRERLRPAADAGQWRDTFAALHPSQRQPPGAQLGAAESANYRGALAALTAQPLPTWIERLALVSDLANAVPAEPDPLLRELSQNGLRAALRHALQWSFVDALSGQDPALVDVRLRALDWLHRAGGPDSVPLLLALMINTPERKAAGEPDFDPDPMMQLRLIHLCGQLDRARAETAVRLPGQMAWQAVAPAEFLARIALDEDAPVLGDDDALQRPATLLAREALARCLLRSRVGLAEAAGSTDAADGADWVATWRQGFQRRQVDR